MQKWEYFDFSTLLFEQVEVVAIQSRLLNPGERKDYYVYLENLGKDGWELVAVQENHFYFKRPLAE